MLSSPKSDSKTSTSSTSLSSSSSYSTSTLFNDLNDKQEFNYRDRTHLKLELNGKDKYLK